MNTNTSSSEPSGAGDPPRRRGRRLRTWPRILVALGLLAALIVAGFAALQRLIRQVSAQGIERNGYSLHTALYAYAQNHNGEFPSTGPDGAITQTANQAFRQLFIADLIDDEKIFWVKRCPWCWKKPDGDIGDPETNHAKAIEAGENHWAYVRNLKSGDDGRLPLLSDGFAAGKPGQWSADPKERGGIWHGDYAVVVRIGGNSKLWRLDSSLTAKDTRNGSEVNIFSAAYGTNPANVLNPE